MLFSFADIFFGPLWLIIIVTGSLLFRNRYYEKNEISFRLFFPALGIKLFGGFLLGLIYQFVYKYGDTFGYHYSSELIWNYLVNNNKNLISLWTAAPSSFGDELEKIAGISIYSNNGPAWFTSKIVAFISIFTGHSYVANGFILSAYAFSGIWFFYRSVCSTFPGKDLWFGLACFFVPSVWFWGSGVMKDSIALGSLGFLYFGWVELFIKGKNRILGFILVLLMAFILFKIKVYILLTFIPFAGIIGVLELRSGINNPKLKSVILPAGLILASFVSYGILTFLNQLDKRFAFETLLEYALLHQQDLLNNSMYYVNGGGSFYDIGKFEPTLQGISGKFIPATLAGLFRPWIWESQNLVMFLSAFESLIILLLTIYTLLNQKISQFFVKIFTNRYLFMWFMFSVFFLFAVGLTTSNFGTLVRYRIPALPFYLCSILAILSFQKKPLSPKDLIL